MQSWDQDWVMMIFEIPKRSASDLPNFLSLCLPSFLFLLQIFSKILRWFDRPSVPVGPIEAEARHHHQHLKNFMYNLNIAAIHNNMNPYLYNLNDILCTKIWLWSNFQDVTCPLSPPTTMRWKAEPIWRQKSGINNKYGNYYR